MRLAHRLKLITASVVPERRRVVAASTLASLRKTFRERAAIRVQRGIHRDAFTLRARAAPPGVACALPIRMRTRQRWIRRTHAARERSARFNVRLRDSSRDLASCIPI